MEEEEGKELCEIDPSAADKIMPKTKASGQFNSFFLPRAFHAHRCPRGALQLHISVINILLFPHGLQWFIV